MNAHTHLVSVLLGLAIVSPFFILEWVTTSGFAHSGFPLTLFIMMWVNSTLFVIVLFSVARNIREGTVHSNLWLFIIKSSTLVILGWALMHIVLDQMPCFLGATGC